MSQKVFVAGDVLTAADVNTFLAGEGGQWSSWTPTVTQGGAVSVTVTYARYARYGRTIHFNASLAVTGTGTGFEPVEISGLPATAATSALIVGQGSIFDASATAYKSGVCFLESTTTFSIRSEIDAAPFDNRLGLYSFTAGLASGDNIRIQGTYEAAT